MKQNVSMTFITLTLLLVAALSASCTNKWTLARESMKFTVQKKDGTKWTGIGTSAQVATTGALMIENAGYIVIETPGGTWDTLTIVRNRDKSKEE